MQLELYNTKFKLEPVSARRRLKTQPIGECNITCRTEHLKKRDRTLTARYYYWTEIARRRFDDVIRILAEEEFFLDERTVSSIIVNTEDYYLELLAKKPSKDKLQKKFSSFKFD